MSEADEAVAEMGRILAKARSEDPYMALVEAGTLAMHCGLTVAEFEVARAATPGDAPGVALRAFIAGLVGRSPEAGQTVANLGLRFYSDVGDLRPMAEIGAELNRGLRWLGARVRPAVVETIFGEGAPTAFGLMALAKGAPE